MITIYCNTVTNTRFIRSTLHTLHCLCIKFYGAQTTLQAGNAPAAPLVLHGVVGDGDHLPSGDPNARLPFLFHKKKKKNTLHCSWYYTYTCKLILRHSNSDNTNFKHLNTMTILHLTRGRITTY